MLSNCIAVRWLKLLLVVLISYGIWKYRATLAAGLAYAASLRLGLAVAALLAAVGVLSAALRIKYAAGRLGAFLDTRGALEAFLVTTSSVFSLVKMSSSVGIYYLTKKGLPLSQAATIYVAERFFAVLVFFSLGVLFFGQFSWVSLAGLACAVAAFVVVTRYPHVLPDFRLLDPVKDFSQELVKLTSPAATVMMVVPELINILVATAALSYLAGAPPTVALDATLVGVLLIIGAPVPAGVGLYEPAVAARLVAGGVPQAVAIGSVLTYRLFNLWLPAVAGLWSLHRL
jgi:hypothetical protein